MESTQQMIEKIQASGEWPGHIVHLSASSPASQRFPKNEWLGLVRTLATEYAPKGITVNAVSPDMMETKFLSNLSELAIEQSAKDNPRGRNIKVEECVPAIEYFLSSVSDMVTGQNMGITGGAR